MTGKLPGRILVLFLVLFAVARAWAGTLLSLSEYRQQLHDLISRVDSLAAHPEDIGKVSGSIPDQVVVKVSRREINVSYRDLKNDLAALSRADAGKRSAGLSQIHNYLQTLVTEAETHDAPVDLDAAHRKLADILAHREFRNTRGPSLRDVLLSKLFAWLNRVLSKLFGARGVFDWFTFLVYAVIGVALLVVSVWTVRRFRGHRDEPGGREIVPFSPSARSWRAWLDEARQMARQEAWRDAIHLAYWAGISYLESGGAWKPNRARTPREYLRLLGTRKPEYPPLAALTRKFEVVWYGARDASGTDFQETLGQLEKLGCR